MPHSNASQVQKKFWIACSAGAVEDVARLLEQGASASAGNMEGITGMHFAAARGHAEVRGGLQLLVYEALS